MNKLTQVGEYNFKSLSTYRELIKIFINLYLNRYYSKYFTIPKDVMKKYKENHANENNYETPKSFTISFVKMKI